jgi:hypothetical protein
MFRVGGLPLLLLGDGTIPRLCRSVRIWALGFPGSGAEPGRGRCRGLTHEGSWSFRWGGWPEYGPGDGPAAVLRGGGGLEVGEFEAGCFRGGRGDFGRCAVEFAAFHHCGDLVDVREDGDILQRVAVEQDQVSVKAGQDLAEFVRLLGQFPTQGGGGDDGFHLGVAEEVDKVLQIAGIGAVGGQAKP